MRAASTNFTTRARPLAARRRHGRQRLSQSAAGMGRVLRWSASRQTHRRELADGPDYRPEAVHSAGARISRTVMASTPTLVWGARFPDILTRLPRRFAHRLSG